MIKKAIISFVLLLVPNLIGTGFKKLQGLSIGVSHRESRPSRQIINKELVPLSRSNFGMEANLDSLLGCLG